MELRIRIKRAREGAGLSQRALAERLGVTRGAVGQWESGEKKPSRDNLIAVARVTMVKLRDLVEGDGAESNGDGGAFALSESEVDLIRHFRLLPPNARENIHNIVRMNFNVARKNQKERNPL